MTKPKIALQLFSVRGECDKDLPATLKSVAGLGFAGAEGWGYTGDSLSWKGQTGPALRKLYDDNNLACCGFHISTGALVGDNLKRSVEFSQFLGNRFLIIASDFPRMATLPGILELARILNEAAQKLQPFGMFCGYHAHGPDFARVEGQVAWDVLFSKTRPEVVMQLDVGNCANGGGDPMGTLRRFPGRARSLHLKDWGGPDLVIGEGKTDWAEILRLCDTTQNTEWYVIEEGGQEGLGFDVSRRSLANLRRILG